MALWRRVACLVVVMAGCKSDPAPLDAGPQVTEVVPSVSAPSAKPGKTPFKLSAGLAEGEIKPVIGAPLLLTTGAAAGDTRQPVTISTPPTLALKTPDGGVVSDVIESIPTRATGTLTRGPGRKLEEQFLTVDWLLPATLTSKLAPGVHVATVTWAGVQKDLPLDFEAPADARQLAVVTANVNCAAGRLKHDPRLMLSTVDAGLQAVPQDFLMTACLAEALQATGEYERAKQAAWSLPDGPDATRLLFELSRLPDGGVAP